MPDINRNPQLRSVVESELPMFMLMRRKRKLEEENVFLKSLPAVAEALGLKINYTPRGDRAIVKRAARPEAIPGQMVVPNSQQKPLDEGIVVAVGPEIPDITVGQHICFVEFAGTEVEIDGQVYLSMRDSEIHGVRKAKA